LDPGVTRVRDLSPEAQSAHWDRIQRSFDLVDEANERLAERAAQREADGTAAEERYQERMRQAEARQQPAKLAPAQPATMDPATAAALNVWADRKIKALLDNELVPLAKEIGETTGRAEKRITALEDRTEKNDAAVVELIRELENRVVELEKRAVPVQPSKPRLVGGSDAA
jgi:hypothetical protein